MCRRASVDDIDGVAAFMRRAAGVEIPPPYWRWRYFENPAGPSGIVIALDGNQIVGLMSAFAVPFRLGSQQLVASQMGHNDILESHRAKKAYFHLAAALFHELLEGPGIDFCYGVAIRETRDLSVVMMDFDEVAPVRKLVRIINPVPHLRKKWSVPLPRALGVPGDWAARRAANRALRGCSVSRFDHFSQVRDAEQRDADDERRLAVSRDEGYMEWRYVRCPTQRYEKFQLRSSGGDLLAWMVCHLYEEQGIRYGVLDECFGAGRDGVARLVDLVVLSCLEMRVDAIVAWAASGTALHRELRNHGFALRPSPRSIIVRQLGDRVPQSVLRAEDRWSYAIGDTEYWLFPVVPGLKEA